MAIQYRPDPDLAFLQRCSENDLQVLVTYLTHDDDGQKRFTCSLMDDDKFKKLTGNPGKCQKCWDLIAAELQLYGGNTIVNTFRGHGVLYKEIISDVCERMKVKPLKTDNIVDIEFKIFAKLGAEIYEAMDDTQREDFLRCLGRNNSGPSLLNIAGIDINRMGIGYLIAQLAAATARKIAGEATSSLITSQMRVHSLPATSISALSRTPSWALDRLLGMILAGLSIQAISGPAFRVTVPSVIQIGYMRRKMLYSDEF